MNPFRLFSFSQTSYNSNPLRNGSHYDKTLLWLLLGLLCFGLVMVYSASIPREGSGYLVRQGKYTILGLIMCYGLIRIPMWRWQKATKYILGLSIFLLLLTYFFGTSGGGARRWLLLPFGMRVQPSEIFKLVTIMYMADFFKRKINILDDYKRVLFVGVPIGLGVFLISLGRDLGSMVVIGATFLALMFLASMPQKWFIASVLLSIIGTVLAIVTSGFRMLRMGSFGRPWKDPSGAGYQNLNALVAMENGSLSGQGLGNSLMKHGYLPEAHNDFIFSVIGEELGFIAIFTLIVIYLWIVLRAFQIGKRAESLRLHFNSFIAFGIGILIALQSVIHIGVNLSMLPNKGLTLPLISYGGSSLIMTMIAFTMLLRVDYENRRVIRGYPVTPPEEPQQHTH